MPCGPFSAARATRSTSCDIGSHGDGAGAASCASGLGRVTPSRTKTYDERYFDRWYRDPRSRVVTPAVIARKTRMVIGVAEYFLGRAARSVLDVGCGEGDWYRALRRVRPRIRYLGIDPSEYVVERFGARRNIRL